MKIRPFVLLLLILPVFLGVIAASGYAYGGTSETLTQQWLPQIEAIKETHKEVVTQPNQEPPGWLDSRRMDLSIKVEVDYTTSDGSTTATASINGQILMYYDGGLFDFNNEPPQYDSIENPISTSGTWELVFFDNWGSGSFDSLLLYDIDFMSDYSSGRISAWVGGPGTYTENFVDFVSGERGSYTKEQGFGIYLNFPCDDWDDNYSDEQEINTCSCDFKGNDSVVYYKCERTTQWLGEDPSSYHEVVTATLIPHEEKPLKANPGGPYTVERGGAVQLDGSKSTGSITEYKWTFQPGAGCLDGLSLDAAELKGATQDVTLLCPVTATLTVTDGKDTDSATVPITVTPRSWWDTPFSEYPEGLSTAGAPWCGTTVFSGGQNICALCEGTPNEVTILHPAAEGGSWEKSGGYEISQVNEPGGPFDGYWYVSKYSMEVDRRILINPYILPPDEGGKNLPSGMGNVYQQNLAMGNDLSKYVSAVRQHEEDHSVLMKNALDQAKPAEKVEKLFDKDRNVVKTKADEILQKTENKICENSQDSKVKPTMPIRWRGQMYCPSIWKNEWFGPGKKDPLMQVGGYYKGASCP